MLKNAAKAGIPLISVQSDDLINFPKVIAACVGKSACHPLPSKMAVSNTAGGQNIFYSVNPDHITAELYNSAESYGVSVVFVNCKVEGLTFDAGVLLPPESLLLERIESLVGGAPPQLIAELSRPLQGMNLKQVSEAVAMCSSVYGMVTPASLRKIRTSLGGKSPGLSPMSTDIGFYEPGAALVEWTKTQSPYFVKEGLPPFMRPRGLLLAGPPGVGKTMASRYLANTMGVPLYRLDLAATLNRYIGESEARLASSLSLLDKEEPCVVLIDEVEKLFTSNDHDSSVMDRMLSQLLWWMQDHTSRVLTVLTTNNQAKIPPELYREGRVDSVIDISLLSTAQATTLAHQILKGIFKGKVDLKMIQVVTETVKLSGHGWGPDSLRHSHAWVNKLVLDTIKEKGWKIG